MEDIMEIVKSLKDYGLLIKRKQQSIKQYLGMLLGIFRTNGANLLGLIRAGD